MDKAVRCIIVDDEEGAHLVLTHYLQNLKHVQLIASFYNAFEALEHLHQNETDLMFLDINMPGLTGLQMLKTMSSPPLVILTTAYREHALESYEYRVVDYLVKPFDFQRFMRAIDNVFSRIQVKEHDQIEVVTPATQSSIMLKVDGDLIKIGYSEIYYLQSWGNYVKVYTAKGTFLSPITTTEIEQRLDRTTFRRIHKSYIVALKNVKRITGGQVELDNGTLLPIGSTYRRELMDCFS